MTKTIVQLATEYLTYFECKERANTEEFYCLKNGQPPKELTELIFEAHGQLMPDDYKYQFVYETLDLISEQLGDTREDKLRDLILQIEPDIYYQELNKWATSRVSRAEYMDQILEEHAGKFNFRYFSLLEMAQVREKQEVAEIVLNALVELTQEDGE